MKKQLSILLVAAMLVFSLAACQSTNKTEEKKQETQTEGKQSDSDTKQTEKTESKEQEMKEKLKVAVTILPQLEWVKAVGGDKVEVTAILPPGASPEVYQASPKEMVALEEADIYFPISVPVEVEGIIPNTHTSAVVVNLAEKAAMAYPDLNFEDDHDHDHEGDKHDDHAHDHDHEGDKHDKHDHDHEGDKHDDHGHDHEGDKHDDHGHDHEGDKHDDHDDHDHHHHSGRDPHIWMSPRRVAVMVDSIAEALAKLDAENADYYLSNAKAYREKLDQLTSDLHKLLHDSKDKSFIIMHPSMGYFAEDFDLEQISIEKEGKQATADHMKSVIDYARENNIKVIFYQKEFDNNQAKTIASEIGGEVMELEPLAENYLQNLEKIGQAFAKVLGK